MTCAAARSRASWLTEALDGVLDCSLTAVILPRIVVSAAERPGAARGRPGATAPRPGQDPQA